MFLAGAIPSAWLDPTLVIVCIGSAIVGLSSGSLGTFAVLRRQSLMGDAISHAALPGIVLGYLLFGKIPVGIILVAGIVGWLSMFCVNTITERSRVPFDSALGGTLAVFFGFGLALLTYFQRGPRAAEMSEAKGYLFGQASLLTEGYIWTLAGICSVQLLLLVCFWKEFKLCCFDPDFAASLAFPKRMIDSLLTALLVVAIVLGLQSVGVVLMSTLLVAPAVAVRPWTNRLAPLVAGAGLVGSLSAIGGTILSTWLSHEKRPVPPGPVIVLLTISLVMISLLASKGFNYIRRERSVTGFAT